MRHSPALLALSLLWASLTPIALPLVGRAQPQAAAQSTIQYTPPPPPDLGEPTGRGQGGGTRSPGCQRYESLLALAPEVQTQRGMLLWGQTASDRPTFWFYAPQGLSADVPTQFVLKDDTGVPIYRLLRRTVESPAGVFGITLPDRAVALQPGRVYRWSMTVYCDPEVDTPLVLQGSIQRQPVAQNQHVPNRPLEAAQLYARNGAWYDALTVLLNAQQRSGSQQTLTALNDLLQQVKLTVATPVSLIRSPFKASPER